MEITIIANAEVKRRQVILDRVIWVLWSCGMAYMCWFACLGGYAS